MERRDATPAGYAPALARTATGPRPQRRGFFWKWCKASAFQPAAGARYNTGLVYSAGMRRREFVSSLGAGALAAAAIPGCSKQQTGAAAGVGGKTYDWKMVTTWPPNFPGLGTGAAWLAKTIESASGGRLRIKVYGGGELVPALEVFDAVAGGTAEMGHGAGYYWKGKSEAAQFFGAVPFGMEVIEVNGWLYHGGGLDLWREVYEPFGLVPFPAGNTGVQMGGWFNREINSVADLRGLKMRIPGLGGDVLRRAGGTPVLLAGGDVYTALETGAIDATEWVGPYNDLAFGLHKAARYYYYPGWHEPGSVLECIVNKRHWDELSDDLKAIVSTACQAANLEMFAEYTAFNQQALNALVEEHGVEVRRFPDAVLKRLEELSRDVLEELAARDETVRRVYTSYKAFLEEAAKWQAVSELAYLQTRS